MVCFLNESLQITDCRVDGQSSFDDLRSDIDVGAQWILDILLFFGNLNSNELQSQYLALSFGGFG